MPERGELGTGQAGLATCREIMRQFLTSLAQRVDQLSLVPPAACGGTRDIHEAVPRLPVVGACDADKPHPQPCEEWLGGATAEQPFDGHGRLGDDDEREVAASGGLLHCRQVSDDPAHRAGAVASRPGCGPRSTYRNWRKSPSAGDSMTLLSASAVTLAISPSSLA